MKGQRGLTLKRVQRRNRQIQKRYPEDKKIHEAVEQGSMGKKDFLGFITKAMRVK